MWHGKRAEVRVGQPGREMATPLSIYRRRGVQPCLYSLLHQLQQGLVVCHRLPPGSRPPHSAYCSHNTAHSSCFLYLGPLVTPVQSGVPISSVTPQFSLYPRKVSSLPVTCFSWRPQLKLMAPPPPLKSLGIGLTTYDESNMSF